LGRFIGDEEKSFYKIGTWSKFGSGRNDRFETNFFRHVGHSLLPDLSAVTMHSAQNLKKMGLPQLDVSYFKRYLAFMKTSHFMVK
jgi:hypothetical protein